MADLMDKIDVLKLKEILEEKEMKFTVADINALMDAELEKSPEEMNVDLVSLCADILNEVYNNSEKSPEKVSAKRKVKARKILLIAAIVAVLSVIAIPAGARFMPSEAADKIVDFCYDHFKINLRGGDETPTSSAGESELVNNLILESLHTLKLPEVLLGNEYEKSVQVQEDDLMTTIYVDFSNTNSQVSGTIVISQYNDEYIEIGNGVGNVTDTHKNFKQITVGNIDILIFSVNEKIYIKYIEGCTEYEIALLNSEFDTAVKIAESIK